jgi:putative heme-binding domain-containing protein
VQFIQLTLLGALLAASLFAQHAKDDEAAKHPFMGDPLRIEAGRKAFLGGCAGCHGPDGGGGRGPSLIDRAAWHPMTDDNLFATIQNGVGIMPAANLPTDRAWELVAFVRSLTSPAVDVKAPGDPALGEKLFTTSAGCSNCHRISGKGGFAGPDLSNIGRTSTLPKLRRSILDPDYERTPGFHRASLTLRNGDKLSGLVKDRTNYVLQLQLRDGSLRSIPVDTIESMEVTKASAMPKDYATKLSKDDITNLVSFLREQGAK